MAPVMSMCRASSRPGQSLLNSRGTRNSQPRSVAAHSTPDERCNAAIATLSAASLLVGGAGPAVATDLTVAPSPAAVVAGQPSSSKMVAGVAAPSVLFETADLNADVRDTASGYRDPAISTPQDNATGKASSGGVSAPDLGVSDAGDKLSSAADDAASKAKSLFSGKGISALPTNPLAAVADQNADVRGAAADYRDPLISTPQDNSPDILEAAKNKNDTSRIGDKVSGAADDAKDKAKGLLKGKPFSALPTNPLAAVADQNADVRDAASGYRDPAGAVQLDAASDAVRKAKSQATGSDISDKVTGAADDAKDKAKGLFGGKGISALPANPLAAVADQNADVRDAASGYRDPAGAVQLDAASDAVKKAKSQATGSDISDKVTGAADDAKDKAKGLFGGKGISALPTNPLAAVADQNADVRDAASGYRDPAGAVQLDAASDAVKKAKSQATGSDISDKVTGAADDAKGKAKGLFSGKGVSALPANPLAAVADRNRDVRGDAEDYRDPAGAVQQDNAAGAVKGALRGSGPSFNTPSISTPSLSKTNKQVKKGAEKLSKQVGVTNKVKAGRPTYPISGAKLNKPLVQDSTGRSFN